MKINWQRRQLIDISEEITDGSHFSPESNAQGNYPYITVRDIVNDELSFAKCKYVDKKDYQQLVKNGCQPNMGDLLFSKDGTVGKVAVVKSEKKFVVLSSLAIIRPKRSLISPDFLKYILKSDDFISEAIGRKTGVAIKRIILKNLKSINVNYPTSIAEQLHIIKILDEAFAEIAKVKENVERNLENSQELLESYLKNTFAINDKDWEIKTLNQISENLDSRRIPITKKVRKSGKYPYYGASGIVDYVGDYIFDENALLISEDGANLIARSTPIAFSVSGKYWVNNHSHILKFNNITSQRFVEYYFSSIKIDKYVTGAAQPKLNQKMLNSIPIPFPDLSIRAEVVSKLDALSAETKKLEESYKQKLVLLEELKKSLLHQAFTGQL